MDFLPNETKLLIFSYLSIPDLCKVKCVNRLFNLLGGDPLLYQRFLRQKELKWGYISKKEFLLIQRNTLGYYAPDTLKAWKDYLYIASIDNNKKILQIKDFLEVGSHVAIDPKEICFVRESLVKCLCKEEKYFEAELQTKELLLSYKSIPNANIYYIKSIFNILLDVLQKQNKYSELEIQRKEYLSIEREIHGNAHECSIKAWAYWIESLRQNSKFIEAETEQRQLYLVVCDTHGSHSFSTISMWFNWILDLEKINNSTEVEIQCKNFFESTNTVLRQDHRYNLSLKNKYIKILIKFKKYSEAEPIARKLFWLCKKIDKWEIKINNKEVIESNDIFRFNVWYTWIYCLCKVQLYSEAEQQAKELLVLCEKFIPEHKYNPITKKLLEDIVNKAFKD